MITNNLSLQTILPSTVPNLSFQSSQHAPITSAPSIPSSVDAMKSTILNLLSSNENLSSLIVPHSLQNFAQAVLLIFKEGLQTDLTCRLRHKLRTLTRDTSHYLDIRGNGHAFLRQEGISIILHYLRSKRTRTGSPLMTMPCSVLPNYDCINAIEHAIIQEQTSPLSFIAINRPRNPDNNDIDQVSNHPTPLLLFPMSNKRYRLLMTDSIANGKKFTLIDDLRDLVNRLQQNGYILEIFSFDEIRQADSSSCPIFTIHDVIYFNKALTRLQNLISQAALGTPIVLPLEFLLPAQLKLLPQQQPLIINDYIQKHRGNPIITENDIVRFQNRYERALGEITTSSGMTIKQNCFTARQMNRYEGIIWKHLLLTELPTVEQAATLTVSHFNSFTDDRAAQYLNQMSDVKAATFLAQLPTERAATILAHPHITAAVRINIVTTLMNDPTTLEKAKAIFGHPYFTIPVSRGILANISLEKAIILAEAALPLFSKRWIFHSLPESRAFDILTTLGTASAIATLITTVVHNAARAVTILTTHSITDPGKIAAIITHCDTQRASEILNTLPIENATEIFARIASTSLSAAFKIFNAFRPITKTAKLLNAPAMAPYGPSFIANTELSTSNAAEILGSGDVTVSTAAQIVEDSSLPTSRLIEIFSDSRMPQSKTLQIINRIYPVDTATFLAFQLPRDTDAAAAFLNTVDSRRAAIFLSLCSVENQAAILNNTALESSKAAEIFSTYSITNQVAIINSTYLSLPRTVAIFTSLSRNQQVQIIRRELCNLPSKKIVMLLTDQGVAAIRSQIIMSPSVNREAVTYLVATDDLPADIAAELLRARGSQESALILEELPPRRAAQIREELTE